MKGKVREFVEKCQVDTANDTGFVVLAKMPLRLGLVVMEDETHKYNQRSKHR